MTKGIVITKTAAIFIGAFALAVLLVYSYAFSALAQTQVQPVNDRPTTQSGADVRASDTDADGDGYADEAGEFEQGESEMNADAPSDANYNNSRSNRSTVVGDDAGDTDADGRADVSGQPDFNDPDDDGDGVPTAVEAVENSGNATATDQVGSRTSIVKEIDKASPKIIQLRGLDRSTPLLYQSIRTSGPLCPEEGDCDDEDEDVRPDAERPQHALRVSVSGEEIRGASEEAKAEVRQRLQEIDEINDANDFGISVALAALDNESVTEIDTDDEQTTIRYRTQARILGFIPAELEARIEATSEGEEVRYPWYAFLATKEDQPNLRELAAEIRANHNSILSAAVDESDEE